MDVIYEIYMFDEGTYNSINALCDGHINESKDYTGFNLESVGWFPELEQAVKALNNNYGDLHEDQFYKYAFILFKEPGLYKSCGANKRMFFVWNEEKQGFYQEEEYKTWEFTEFM